VAERLNWDRELSEEDFRTYAQLWSGEFLATTAGDRTVLAVRYQDEGAWNVVDDATGVVYSGFRMDRRLLMRYSSR